MTVLKPSESSKIYDINYKLFNASGFGHLENPKKWEKIAYQIYHYIIHFVYVFLISLFFVDAYLVRNDLEKLNLNLCVTVLTAGSMGKIWALMKNFSKLSEIRKNFKNDFYLKHLGKDENHEKIKLKSSKFLTHFTKLILIMAASVVILWLALPLMGKQRKYCIPFPIFQDKKTPDFEIWYVIHGVLLVHFVLNILSNDLNFSGCMLRISDHFDILIYNVSKIKKIYPVENFGKYIKGYEDAERDQKIMNYDVAEKLRTEKEWRILETRKLLRQNIIHHKMVLKQLMTVEDTYKVQLFIQITVGALVISVVAFDVLLQSRTFNGTVIQQGMYVSIALLDILVMCYFGSLVSQKSEELAEALYDIPWYEMDVKNQKICMFMIQKCRKYPTLKAKYIFEINLKTYLQLIKTSYNLMALLSETK